MADFATLILNADSRGLVTGEQALDRFAATAERTEDRTGKALEGVGKASKEVAKQSTYASQALRMQTMQLSQIAQQASATGNIMQAVAIQIPDLALAFGPIGIAAGAAAGAVLSYFSTITDNSDDSAVLLKEQEALIRSVAERWGEAFPPLQQYVDTLEKANDLAGLRAGATATIGDEFDKISEKVESFNGEYGRTLDLLDSTDGTNESVMALTTAFQDLEEKIKTNSATIEDFQRVQNAASKVAASEGFEDIKTFASAFSWLTFQVQGSLDKIAELRPALTGLGLQLQPHTWRSAGMSGQSADGQIQGNGFILPEDGPLPGSRPSIELSGLPGGNKRDRSSDRAAKAYERERQSVADLIKELEEELSLVGQSETAKRSAAAIRQAGATATDQEKEAIAGLITQIDAEQEARDRQIDTMDEYKDSVGSVLDDIRSAMDDGRISWDEWADIALNALDKVISRIQDDLLDAIFSVNKASSSGGGGGGLFSSLFSSIFGGGTGGFAKLPAVGPVPIARPSFDGGGYTGSGARAGGLDGKGGFWAMMHPDETVIDHTKGQSASSQTGGESRVVIELSPDLEGRVMRNTANQTVQIMKQDKRNSSDRYQNGGSQNA